MTDLWELAKHHDYTNPHYYIDEYNPYILYIKKAYYKNKDNHIHIINAFNKAQELSMNSRYNRYYLYLERMGKDQEYEKIQTIEKLNEYLNKRKIKRAVFVSNPGEYTDEDITKYPKNVGIRYSSGGAIYKKSTIKKHICGRDRVIYFGKNNKQYVKMNGRHVAISTL